MTHRCCRFALLTLLIAPAALSALPLASAVTEQVAWQSWFTVILFLITFYVLIRELLVPDLTMLAAAVALLLAGIVTPGEFLLGFSEDIIFSIAMLCIIVRAMETSGIVRFIAENILTSSPYRLARSLSVMLPVGFFSAFLNNTPIVLLMTSAVREWAVGNKLSPSKYLIPLSYAAILGGTCTLIGSSATIVVDGMMRREAPAAGLSFFEIGRLGLPCAIAGLLYLVTIGERLLPVRRDPASAVVEQTPEFISEFVVGENCELVGSSVEEAGRRFFRHERLVEIERQGKPLESPSPRDKIEIGDRLVFAGDIQHIAELHAIKGLRSTADPHFHIDVTSPHFSEVVISVTSPLVGRTLKQADFRNRYGASVLAIYRGGSRVSGQVGDTLLQAGDTLMLLSKQPWKVGQALSQDFYYIRHNEELSLFSPWRFALGINLLIGLVIAVMAGVPLIVATIAVAMLLLLAGNITIRQAKAAIRWDLLVLIASSFSLGTALQNTGVADGFARIILQGVGTEPLLLVGTLFLLTSVLTAFITNTAAVVLLFPLALQTVRLAGYESLSALKAIGITIIIAASCSFATPIGYQTNTIVYGPGGYRFQDYIRVGLPLTIIIAIIAIVAIPILWPLI